MVFVSRANDRQRRQQRLIALLSWQKRISVICRRVVFQRLLWTYFFTEITAPGDARRAAPRWTSMNFRFDVRGIKRFNVVFFFLLFFRAAQTAQLNILSFIIYSIVCRHVQIRSRNGVLVMWNKWVLILYLRVSFIPTRLSVFACVKFVPYICRDK